MHHPLPSLLSAPDRGHHSERSRRVAWPELRWLVPIGLALVVYPVCAGNAAGSDQGTTNATGEPAIPYVRVSEDAPRYFELDDGRPYIPIGLNMVAVWGADEDDALSRMDQWLGKLAENGGNFARIWLGSDFWNIEPEAAGEFDQQRAARIDALFAMARRHGIRLKMTFEHFREIDPDTDYARSRAVFTKAVHHVSRGGTARTMEEWFAAEASRGQFRRKLEWFAQRYRDEPMVFGWELWNEINAVRAGNYRDWTAEMLAELHRQFPRHLAMQSLGSFDRDTGRQAYHWLATLPGNDVAQVHRYLDLGAQLEICHGPVDVLVADAIDELLAFEPGRPVLLAESGAVEPQHTGPFHLYENDRQGIILHDVLFAAFFAGGAGCGQCWHWDVYVDRNDLWWQFARFAETVKGVDPTKEQFKPLRIEHSRLRVYALRGTHTTLLWCRDKQNTWQTELAEGIRPEVVRQAELDLSELSLPETATIRCYDPWENREQEPTGTPSALRLPEFRRSLVVRVTHEQPE